MSLIGMADGTVLGLSAGFWLHPVRVRVYVGFRERGS